MAHLGMGGGRLPRDGLDIYVVGATQGCFDGLRAVLRGVEWLRSISLLDQTCEGVPARDEPSPAPALLLLCSCHLGARTPGVLSRVRERDPLLPVIVWTANGSPGTVETLAAEAGNCVRPCPASQLMCAIIEVARSGGCAVVEGSRAETLIPAAGGFRHLSGLAGSPPERPPLSARQEQIRELIAMGLTDKEIARHIGVSYYTVRTHISALLRKCGAGRRAQLVAQQRPAPSPQVPLAC